MVEHMTFNHGVPSSNLGWVTNLADVAELADALALGASFFEVGVRLPSSAPSNKKRPKKVFFYAKNSQKSPKMSIKKALRLKNSI